MAIEKFQYEGSTSLQQASWFGSFSERVGTYIFSYIVLLLLFAVIIGFIFPDVQFFKGVSTIPSIIMIFGVPALVPYFMERSNRKWRRENGYSIYKNIEEEVRLDEKKREIRERVELEEEVRNNA